MILEQRIQRKHIKKHFTFFLCCNPTQTCVPRRDSLLWSLQIHIDMSHAILHSLISQHCAHWTHCCTHTHYCSEQETTYAVPETTTRQKSLVKDHLHSFLVASPSREALIYQEIWAVVFSRHSASLHLSGDRRGEGRCGSFTLLLLFLFSSLASQLPLSHQVWETSLSSHLSWRLFWSGRRWKEGWWHTCCNSKYKALAADRGTAVP